MGETPGFGIRGAGPLVPIRKKGTRKRERIEEPTLSPQEHHGQPSEAQDRETFGIFLGVVLKGPVSLDAHLFKTRTIPIDS